MASEIFGEISRHLDLLTDSSKIKRKRALETIRSKLNGVFDELDNEELLTLSDNTLPHIVKSLSDAVEKHREIAISLASDFITKVRESEKCLPTILPTLDARLCQENGESAEELRLSLVEIIMLLLKHQPKYCTAFVEEFTKIIAVTLTDPFPEVKKESCKCCATLSEVTKPYFSMSSDRLIKPLLQNYLHRHSKVRFEAVKATGSLFMNGNAKSLDEALPFLAQRLFDDSPNVRQAVVDVTGLWLLDLTDRYSFHSKLIPLLLTGITDEHPEIKNSAENYWFDIGIRYEKENEDDLRDKVDFKRAPQKHYPPDIERPNLGCRTLIFRTLSRILPALANDLMDWKPATRIKAAQLLPVLVINSEECMTQHTEKLITVAYRAAVDEEEQVRSGVEKGLLLAGYFVEPRVWWKVLYTQIRQADSSLRGSLSALSCLLSGSDPVLLCTLPLRDVCEALSSEDVAHSIIPDVKWQLLRCVQAVLECAADEDINSNGRFIYYLLCCAMSVTAAGQQEIDVYDAIVKKCHQLMEMLKEKLRLDDVLEMHRLFLPDMFNNFKDTCTRWTRLSSSRFIFERMCIECGPLIGEAPLLETTLNILRQCLHVQKDADFRLMGFVLLAKLVSSLDTGLNSAGGLLSRLPLVVRELLQPNLQWKAGRTAEAVRRVAATTLWALLQRLDVTDGDVCLPLEEADSLRPVLVGLMDEDAQDTRMLAVKCLRRVLLRLDGELEDSARRDDLHQMYPHLLKRMDDSEDQIRLAGCQLFLTWITLLTPGFDRSLYRAHLEEIYKGLLIHLDDTEEQIQSAVLEVLTAAGALAPDLLKEQVERVRHRHRSDKWCADLLRALPE